MSAFIYWMISYGFLRFLQRKWGMDDMQVNHFSIKSIDYLWYENFSTKYNYWIQYQRSGRWCLAAFLLADPHSLQRRPAINTPSTFGSAWRRPRPADLIPLDFKLKIFERHSDDFSPLPNIPSASMWWLYYHAVSELLIPSLKAESCRQLKIVHRPQSLFFFPRRLTVLCQSRNCQGSHWLSNIWLRRWRSFLIEKEDYITLLNVVYKFAR